MIYQLIKTFQLLGCTTVMITHHRHGLSMFDRVLEIENGEIIKDSLPCESSESDNVVSENDLISLRTTFSSGVQQLWWLLKREMQKQWNQKFISWERTYGSNEEISYERFLPQWSLNLFLIPVLFGISIAIVSPTVQFHPEFGIIGQHAPYLVTFLCSLSFIWLAASNSYLSLTNEWERIQYEKNQGLSPYLYLLSKSLTLMIATFIQLCLFSVALWFVRYFILHQPILSGELKTEETSDLATKLGAHWFENMDCHLLWMGVTLFALGWPASQLGLLISAIAKNRTHVATSLLPLIMMLQILFSVFVIRAEKSDTELKTSYEGFYLQRVCEGAQKCPSHNLSYYRDAGFFCESCISRVEKIKDEQKSLSWRLAIIQLQKDEYQFKDEVRKQPGYFATAISYLTLTRYSDIALRPYANNCGPSEESEDAQQYSYSSWSWFGIQSLLGIGILFHVLTALLIGALHPLKFLYRLMTRIRYRLSTKTVGIFISIALLPLPPGNLTAGSLE
ncbi:hypothetical protein [Rubinisphaera sp.]|uniref:hypothetical protein n=1 Tax=Rubinisphaera sp. TaxID=2024857 RepID=UPI000C0FBCC2|nr:hypothetical protein [Rubinisphaera sp.]MBV08517.1 hypothetical protein [Rubinisphaera sp.]